MTNRNNPSGQQQSRYEQRGVSAQKQDVHQAISNLDKGLFPQAFCKIIPDYLVGDPEWCTVMHADGAGTKSSLAYLYWRETGNLSVWKGIAQDAIVMNTDDLLCVGAIGPMLLSSTIGRNKHLVPGEVIKTIIEGTQEFIESMHHHGIEMVNTGGETADIGDLVRTIVVDSSVTARMPRSQVISGDHIIPGDVIVGMASYGQATYETDYNSGIGSNGLTAARHEIFNKALAYQYPESYDPNMIPELVYVGDHRLTEKPFNNDSLLSQYDIGKLVLSPTRTYAPVIKQALKELGNQIHGIIHCSGGGQTKALNYINDNVHVVKDNLFTPPPLFKLIQEHSHTPAEEMYQVFNMGHRMEVYLPEDSAQALIEIANSYNIDAQVVGSVQKGERKKLTLVTSGQEEFSFPQ